jgi:hypothetical protein
MEAEAARRTDEVAELKKAVLEIQRRLDMLAPESGEPSQARPSGGGNAQTPTAPRPKDRSAEITHRIEQATGLVRGALERGEPLILGGDLRGFCVSGGRIWLHETGFMGLGTLASTGTVFYSHSEKVKANRACPEAQIEKFFSIFSNRKRVSLMRALVDGESKSSAALREETGLTEGQFYHHIRDLAAAECLVRGGQDQYRLSEEGKILLLVAEAIASDLGASTHLKPEEIRAQGHVRGDAAAPTG